MNKGKVGAPFEYSRTYIQFLAFLKIGFKISYRTVQGIVRRLSDYLRIEEIHFTQIRRRILKVKPSVGNLNPDNDDDSKPITLIVDASGLTITKNGDYIEQKWIRKKNTSGAAAGVCGSSTGGNGVFGQGVTGVYGQCSQVTGSRRIWLQPLQWCRSHWKQ